MTAMQFIEIKGCQREYNAKAIKVDLKEPNTIGLGIENEKPNCPPSGDNLNNVNLIVTRGEDYKEVDSPENIAKINLECPESRCRFHSK